MVKIAWCFACLAFTCGRRTNRIIKHSRADELHRNSFGPLGALLFSLTGYSNHNAGGFSRSSLLREASAHPSLRARSSRARSKRGDLISMQSPGESFYGFGLPIPGYEMRPRPPPVDFNFEMSLPAVENAIANMFMSYQSVGVVQALITAVRHRWARLPPWERPLLLITLRQLWRLRAESSDLVAVALSTGSVPPLGEQAGLRPDQVAAAFGMKTLALLTELQQLATIETTLVSSYPQDSPSNSSMTQGQVDLALSLFTSNNLYKDGEGLILFLVHKASELRFVCQLTKSSSPSDGFLRSVDLALKVFAPLANLVGLGKIKDELEDAAFEISHPEERAEMMRLLGSHKVETVATGAARQLQTALSGKVQMAELKAAGLTSLRVSARAKTAYSTWQKMNKKNLTFDTVWDKAAIRVILDARSPEEAEALCYMISGIAGDLWTLVDGRAKDYVRNQKANGYQSIHLVAERLGEPFEIQIRSEQMHRKAEYGSSGGHWEYKAGGNVASDSSEAIEAGAEIFADIDSNGDGRISDTELQAALQRVGVDKSLEEVRSMLEVFDADHDGEVDFNDFWKALLTTWFPLISGAQKPRMTGRTR